LWNHANGPENFRHGPSFSRAKTARGEGASLLREFPNPLGVLLSSTYRELMCWIECGGALFSRELYPSSALFEIAAEERTGDELLGELWRAGQAYGSGAAALTRCCSDVAQWAQERRCFHTALAYMQIVALLSPDNAGAGLRTARLARDVGQYGRAETWFRHSIKTSRRRREWRTFVDAHRGLGTLYLRVGNYPAAHLVFERTLAGAKRWCGALQIGAAHHDLFLVHANLKDVKRAPEQAQEALTALDGAEPAKSRLVADLATFLFDHGHYSRAVDMYLSVVETAPDESTRALRTANLLRATAHAGMRERYESLREVAHSRLAAVAVPKIVAECFVLIASADLAAREWTRAETVARTALTRAEQSGAGEIVFAAEDILRRASARDYLAEESEGSPGFARMAERLSRLVAVSR
jgi:tetratricopeptide (TPR) repeat protein